MIINLELKTNKPIYEYLADRCQMFWEDGKNRCPFGQFFKCPFGRNTPCNLITAADWITLEVKTKIEINKQGDKDDFQKWLRSKNL